jgi:hypothetical protein
VDVLDGIIIKALLSFQVNSALVIILETRISYCVGAIIVKRN